MNCQFYFFLRLPAGDVPPGFTVSKRDVLPDGDFRITEFTWGLVTLWFLDSDKFTADERQAAYEAHVAGLKAECDRQLAEIGETFIKEMEQ